MYDMANPVTVKGTVTGVPNEDIERHARHGEDHDIGGAGEREAARQQRKGQHRAGQRGDHDG